MSDPIKPRGLDAALSDVRARSERLASGKRINRASDDAAGLAVASSLDSAVRISNVARRNVADAGSALGIADGALSQLGGIGTRLAELAARSANGTLNDSQRGALNAEFSQLSQEAARITATTTFNGVSLLSGSSSLGVQAGADSSADSRIDVGGVDGAGLTASLAGLDVSTASGAAGAVSAVSDFIAGVASTRGSLGAAAERLAVADGSLATSALEGAAARSRIEDADVAAEVADLTASRIRADVGAALAAQSGSLSRESVLRLLA